MSSGYSNKLTGQIGEYLVCAELGRRGLIATPFSGNVPTFDILATDRRCRTVPIQVKASRSDTWPSDARHWMLIDVDPDTQRQICAGPRPIENPELIYVCVSIAPPEGRDRFFILTRAELQKVCIQGYHAWMSVRDWKRPRNPWSFDNRYYIHGLLAFENNWQLVTERLQSSRPDPSLTSEEDNQEG